MRTALLFALLVPTATAQTLTEVFVPQVIQGVNGTNTNRTPFAYRVTLGGLTPGATYRYINQVVVATDASTAAGAGNILFANPAGFTRTSGPSLSTAGNYGEFAADATGTYTGWFVTEPTGNAARFVPGTALFARISLNDGSGGTTAAVRLTTASSFTVVNYGTASSAAAEGTFLYGTSSAPARDFVLAYDTEAGTGRPVAATFVESDGTDNTAANSYAAPYANLVHGVAGAWGMIVPNALPSGIRRVERRTAAGTLAAVSTDADGVWPGADGMAGTADDVNTVNPSGGRDAPLFLPASNVPLPSEHADAPGTGLWVSLLGSRAVRITANTPQWVSVSVYDVLGRAVTTQALDVSGTGVMELPGLAAGAYVVRVVGERVVATKTFVVR